MPKPVAAWNSARDVWETPQTEGFFCEHLDVFSETFPTSGMTVSGVAYELPTWEPATQDSESSSLLKTPTSQLAVNGGSQHPDKRKAGGHGPTLADEVEHLLLTPMAAEGEKATIGTSAIARSAQGRQPFLTNQIGDLMRGASTAPQSADGNQLWEDVPLPLPS